MTYISIALGCVTVMLLIRLLLLKRAMKAAISQMIEIEKKPNRNRQLKDISAEKDLELLLKHINDIYRARQQERIIYQRRETQIRREIENISHDLRTPLTSILGYIGLIREEEDKREREEYLDIIQKRAKVLQGFIQDFYELSRIEADDYPLLWDRISVQNNVAEVTVAYYNEFERRDIQVEMELEDKPCYIIADNIAFNRIMNNLVQNALKYSKALFTIKQFTSDKECIIQFRNEKGSLTAGELELIFDRFYTSDPSRSNQSTGLGLTITKILTNKMMGSISAFLEENYLVIELRFPIKGEAYM